MVTFQSIQSHPGLAYIFNLWHSGTAQMSEIENVV